MKRITMLLGAGSLLLCSTVFAAVPQLINFQGILRDESGNPVADGSYSVTFTIYDAAGGGNVKWTETQSVSTTSGLFSVLLGSTNPVPDSAFDNPNRYLGIQVSADPEMTPRLQLTSVGYSHVSSQWTPAGQNLFRLDGNVGIGTASPGAKLEVGGTLKVGGSETGTASDDIKAYIQKVACEARRGIWIDGVGCQEYAYFTSPCTFSECSCAVGYHLCTIVDLLSGGFNSLRRPGYNPPATYAWISGSYQGSGLNNSFFYPWQLQVTLKCDPGTHFMINLKRNAAGNTAWGCYSDSYTDVVATCCRDNQ